jgi:hypothetical protein
MKSAVKFRYRSAVLLKDAVSLFYNVSYSHVLTPVPVILFIY